MFKKAQRKQARLRLALQAAAGGGKTESALRLARGIVGPQGRIAVLDTEHGSSELYCDITDFDVCLLNPPYTPERYQEVIAFAERDYDILIIDSLSHEWIGTGGILEIHAAEAKRQRGGNSFAAWANVTPRHNKLINAMLRSPLHIIATMRQKTDFVLEDDRNGKKVPRKIGMAPIQREGLEYEFTVVLDLESRDGAGGWAIATKDRTRLFADPRQLSQADGEALALWLETGVSVEDQIQADSTQLLATLVQAAEQGLESFRTAWRANAGPVRDRIENDQAAMVRLKTLTTTPQQ